MKRKFSSIFVTLVLLGLITACDNLIGGRTTSPPLECNWRNNVLLYFYNADLRLPCSGGNCDYQFQNALLYNLLDYHSLYKTMSTVQQNSYYGNSFEFLLTITIASKEKQCSETTGQYRHVTLDQNTYTQNFTFPNDDLLEGCPYVAQDSNCVYPYHHKFDLTFQIHGVENTYNGHVGTITWKVNWDQPLEAGTNEWWLNFPNEGVIGKFIADRYYEPIRHIYINGQYEDI